MDLKTYQEETRKTAVYPPHEQKGYYPILALCGEVGELAGAFLILALSSKTGELANSFKKVLRGDYKQDDPVYKAKMMDELGDVLWYVARVAEDLGFDLNEVAKFNLKKLKLRKATGRLKSHQ